MYAKVTEVEPGCFEPVLKIKHLGRVDLGAYSSARLAAVAHDVARLAFISERRPDTDLRCDAGLHFPADGYLVDPTFKQLLDARTSFADVCDLLRSGALADQFLCAQDRQTRGTSSGNSGGRQASAATRPKQELVAAAAAQQQEGAGGRAAEEPAAAAPLRSQQPSDGTAAEPAAAAAQAAAAAPPPSPFSSAPGLPAAPPAPQPAAAAAAAAAAPADPGASPTKRKPMRWLEWPTKGGGQYATCISERALKNNMTLPAKMKRELFQVSEQTAHIAAHDLAPGSTLRWQWEVRDYVKDERNSTYIHNLGDFFAHYNASPGDVMVVVASAPGAVKATIWRGDSQDAAKFKAHLEKQSKPSGGSGSGAGKKRAADSSPPQQGLAKVPKQSAGGRPDPTRSKLAAAHKRAEGTGASPTGSSKQQASFSQDPSRQLTKTGSGPLHEDRRQQQQQKAAVPSAPPLPSKQRQGAAAADHHPQQQQQQEEAQLRADELLAMAEAGVDASHPSGGDDTQHLSPTSGVVQSPFRQQPLLPPLASMAIKVEQPSPAEQEQQAEEAAQPPAIAAVAAGVAAAAATAAGAGAEAGAATAATHSPARMSCADISPAARSQQQPLLQQRHQGPAAHGQGAAAAEALPDAMSIASDEGAVYIAMSCLLNLVAGTGRVPAEAVSAYRRSFGRLEPAGRRWFHYDSLKQLVEAGEWEDVQQWLACNN